MANEDSLKYNISPEQITSSHIPMQPQDIQQMAALQQADLQKLTAQRQAEQQKLATELRDKLERTKKKAESMKKDLLGKYKENIMGISVLPPKPKQQMPQAVSLAEEIRDNEPELLILLNIKEDDLDKKYKKKDEIVAYANKLRDLKLKDSNVNCVMLDEVWDACMKGKYEILNILTIGMPVYDNGWMGSLRAVELHKMKVLQKFEKYVICYVLTGSTLRGEATETSDIDTFIVIDDTDVSRMTSRELQSKLLSIIWGMASESCMQAGVGNKLNVQVYVLSEFWSSLRDAHPVMFTMVREGIPLYDRGLFAPWKLLLQRGRIRPTPEAIDSYIKSGQQGLDRIKFKLREMGVEDFFWATSIPAQGALMLEGIDVPVHTKVVAALRDHFIKKRKLLTEADIKPLDEIITLRKDIEHGRVKEVSAKQVKELMDGAERFLKRLDRLFKQLEKEKMRDESQQLYTDSMDDIQTALSMLNVKVKDPIEDFKKHLVDKKLVPTRFYDLIKKIEEAKDKQDLGRETLGRMRFEEEKFSNDMLEHVRDKIGLKMDKFKISAHYAKGNKTAAIWLLTDTAYVIMDVAKPDTDIKKYKIAEDGEIMDPVTSTLNEINSVLRTFKGTPTVMTGETIKSLKKILSDDVKIVIGA